MYYISITHTCNPCFCTLCTFKLKVLYIMSIFQIVKFLKKNCLIVCGIYQALLKDTSGEVRYMKTVHYSVVN